MDASRDRARGSATPSAGSDTITRSRTAGRSTARTLPYLVLIVPGASPADCMALTHCSTWERRSARSGTSANVTDPAASRTPVSVPDCHTWRRA